MYIDLLFIHAVKTYLFDVYLPILSIAHPIYLPTRLVIHFAVFLPSFHPLCMLNHLYIKLFLAELQTVQSTKQGISPVRIKKPMNANNIPSYTVKQ